MAVIVFVGLGQMGLPMATSLIRAGHQLRGVDTAPAAREAAARHGIAVADDLPDALRGADAVITMFAQGGTVLEVWRALLPIAEPDTLFIDCSTIGVDDARQAHALARAAGMESLDAPVTGGVSGAEAGTLLFIAGGAEDAFARAEPLFEAMGRAALLCGPDGAGQAAKLCNNLLLGVSMIGVGEAFVLGEKLGVAPDALYEAMAQSSGQCWSLTSYCPIPGPVPESPANHDFTPGFTARQMHNDLTLATAAAARVGAAATLARQATSSYAAMLADGQGERDFSAVIRTLDRSASSDYATIKQDRQGRVGVIAIDRPKALNALNLEVMQEIVAAAAALDADDTIGCIVLTGSAQVFAAGADIKEMQAMGYSEVYRTDWCAGWDALSRIRKPIVGAVAGLALGGGCEVAMMCDVLLAATSAKFGQPEIKLGTLPGMGGSQRLTRLIGKPKAMEMCLTGRLMDAEEAERSGLVSRVVPTDQLLAEALRTAQTIAAGSLAAAMMVKDAVNAAYETTLGQGVRYERRLFHGSFATADQKEGMAAFAEKRPPRFTNR